MTEGARATKAVPKFWRSPRPTRAAHPNQRPPRSGQILVSSIFARLRSCSARTRGALSSPDPEDPAHFRRMILRLASRKPGTPR